MLNNIEKERYEKRFKESFANCNFRKKWGSKHLKPFYRAPYEFFEDLISKTISRADNVLEIGSGDGAYTYCLLQTGANITATDVAPTSLKIIEEQFNKDFQNNLQTCVADMRKLPFKDKSFDIVISAGSLSYGNNKIVIKEIKRVLKKNGKLILVDSLNHNIIYRLNRFVQYFRGKRSWMTIKNMPNMNTINFIVNNFPKVQVRYFGSITWIAPILSPLFRSSLIILLVNKFDKIIKVKKTAFKIVIKAEKIDL